MEIKCIVDKIVIEALTTETEMQNLLNRALLYYGDEGVEIYQESFRKSSYRHAFKVMVGDEQTIFIQFRHNMEKPNSQLRYKMRVEFNPNKLHNSPYLDEVIQYFTYMPPRYVNIIRADIACDYPVNIENVRVFRHGKSRHLIYREETVTHYLGKGDNRVKIYDKQAERKRLGIDIPETTRIEVTRKIGHTLENIRNYMPAPIPHPVYILPEQYDVNQYLLNPVHRAILYAMEYGVITFQDLPWHVKKPIRHIMDSEWLKVDLPPDREYKALIDTLSGLFPVRFMSHK